MKKLVFIVILISIASLLFAYGGRVEWDHDTTEIDLGANLVDTSAAVSDSFVVTVGEYYKYTKGTSDSIGYWNNGAFVDTISTSSCYFTATTYDSVIVYGDCSTASVQAKVEDWTAQDPVLCTRFSSIMFLIHVSPTDSIVAYRVKGYVYYSSTTTDYYMVCDSTQVTGADGDIFEWDPNNYGKMVLELYEISDSVDVTIDWIQKNPYE